jgi:hypothetical protein
MVSSQVSDIASRLRHALSVDLDSVVTSSDRRYILFRFFCAHVWSVRVVCLSVCLSVCRVLLLFSPFVWWLLFHGFGCVVDSHACSGDADIERPPLLRESSSAPSSEPSELVSDGGSHSSAASSRMIPTPNQPQHLDFTNLFDPETAESSALQGSANTIVLMPPQATLGTSFDATTPTHHTTPPSHTSIGSLGSPLSPHSLVTAVTATPVLAFPGLAAQPSEHARSTSTPLLAPPMPSLGALSSVSAPLSEVPTAFDFMSPTPATPSASSADGGAPHDHALAGAVPISPSATAVTNKDLVGTFQTVAVAATATVAVTDAAAAVVSAEGGGGGAEGAEPHAALPAAHLDVPLDTASRIARSQSMNASRSSDDLSLL